MSGTNLICQLLLNQRIRLWNADTVRLKNNVPGRRQLKAGTAWGGTAFLVQVPGRLLLSKPQPFLPFLLYWGLLLNGSAGITAGIAAIMCGRALSGLLIFAAV